MAVTKETLNQSLSEDTILELTARTVNFGAGDYRVCHQPNEFVDSLAQHQPAAG